MFCAVNETTEKVLRERDSRESMEALAEFRDVADQVPNIIYTHSPDATVEWANKRWYEYTRLPVSIGTVVEGWERVTHPDDLKNVLLILKDAFTDGTSYEVEARFKADQADDSAYRWHLLRASPVRKPNGKITRWVGSATDIHDRRIAATEAHERLERELAREHRVATAMQSASLPKELPVLPDIEMHAVYIPGNSDAQIGGDWYEAFQLRDGRIIISIGDVAGSGLDAAVTMSNMRQIIRGTAQVYADPVMMLNAADRALRLESPTRFVTAFVGVFDPITRHLTYASAGHPPPYLRKADGSLVELTFHDLPLGLRHRSTERPEIIDVPDDALLVLYTDGLIESSHDVLQGIANLECALRDPRIQSVENPAEMLHVMLLPEQAKDDVAILTLRIAAALRNTGESNTGFPRRWSLNHLNAEAAHTLRQQIRTIFCEERISENDMASAELILGELIGNVVRYAPGPVEVVIDIHARSVAMHVMDQGPGFERTPILPLDIMSESGRGLYIVSQLVDEFNVSKRPGRGSHARAVITRNVR